MKVEPLTRGRSILMCPVHGPVFQSRTTKAALLAKLLDEERSSYVITYENCS